MCADLFTAARISVSAPGLVRPRNQMKISKLKSVSSLAKVPPYCLLERDFLWGMGNHLSDEFSQTAFAQKCMRLLLLNWLRFKWQMSSKKISAGHILNCRWRGSLFLAWSESVAILVLICPVGAPPAHHHPCTRHCSAKCIVWVQYGILVRVLLFLSRQLLRQVDLRRWTLVIDVCWR